MALTELLSTLSIGTYEQEFPTAFARPAGPGSTNGDPQDGSLFKDSNGNGIPDRTISGYTSNGQFTTFATKEASYNKFNLRTDSHNKNSFGNVTDQPFILRGLQRPNSAQPQFWGGFADTLTDIPRGGITTAVEREAVDKARIGKFMISPKGLIFQAKQFGLQLMNPNVEGVTGFWTGVTPRSNKIYNPLSVFSLNAPVPFHIRRDSFDPSGLTSYNYESVINERNVLGFGTRFNRLTTLHTEAFDGFGLGPLFNTPIGLPYLTITDLTGPKSVLGIGITSNKRYTNTSLRQSSLLLGAPGLEFITSPLGIATGAGINTGATYDINRYKNSNILADLRTYLQPTPLSPKYTPGQDDTQWSKNGRTKIRAIIDNPISFPQDSKVLGNDRNLTDFPKRYNTVAYGKLERNTAIHDFRSDLSNPVDYPFSIKSTNTGVGKNAKDKEYKDSNLVKRIGIGDYGAINLDRSDPRYVIDKNTTVITSHKEKADQLVLGNSTKDLVQFVIQIFEDDQYKTVTRFRSYIDSISTSFNQNVKSVFPANAVIPFDAYDRTVRQLSVDFKVPILSAVEREIIMSKLNTLAKLQYGIRSTTNFGTDAASSADFEDSDLNDPNATADSQATVEKPQAAPIRIKIGNFTSIGCIINSLSYDIDNETPWDIDYETPMIVNVSLQATETATAYRAGEISNFAYRQSGKIIG